MTSSKGESYVDNLLWQCRKNTVTNLHWHVQLCPEKRDQP